MIPFINKAEVTLKTALIESVTPISPVKPVSDSLKSPQDFTQGKRFLATVGAQLANGNFKVSIADQALQMRLPENIRPGDKMTLVLIAREPQLKFLLQNEAFLNTTKNPSNISATGRFIGLLAQDSAKATNQQPLTSTAPILTNPPTNDVETPVLLQKALSQSGLFYESHQAQWVTGKKTLSQLQQEPQGKLNAAATTSAIALTTTESSVHAQSLHLVQHQLTTLESGQIVWRGEIWPEQFMDWNITEHTPNENKQDTEESSLQWQTQLRLTLPNLGEITATLVFSAEEVRIKLHTPRPETTELLRNNQSPLANALVASGLNIKTIEIHADAKK